jgi:hypothetical protein
VAALDREDIPVFDLVLCTAEYVPLLYLTTMPSAVTFSTTYQKRSPVGKFVFGSEGFSTPILTSQDGVMRCSNFAGRWSQLSGGPDASPRNRSGNILAPVCSCHFSLVLGCPPPFDLGLQSARESRNALAFIKRLFTQSVTSPRGLAAYGHGHVEAFLQPVIQPFVPVRKVNELFISFLKLALQILCTLRPRTYAPRKIVFAGRSG